MIESGEPMINLETSEYLDTVITEQPLSESEIEDERKRKEDEELAKMIQYMPESEKKHLRAMATSRAQNWSIKQPNF